MREMHAFHYGLFPLPVSFFGIYFSLFFHFFSRARCSCSFSYSGGAAALEVVVYYAVCGTARGLTVTQITEAPLSARRAKQLFTVVLPLVK